MNRFILIIFCSALCFCHKLKAGLQSTVYNSIREDIVKPIREAYEKRIKENEEKIAQMLAAHREYEKKVTLEEASLKAQISSLTKNL